MDVNQIDLYELPGKVGKDMALLARLRNLARRLPAEGWTYARIDAGAAPRKTWARSSDPYQPLDNLLREIVARRRDPAGAQTRFGRLTTALKHGFGFSTDTVTEADYDELRREALTDFIRHASKLIAIFESLPIRSIVADASSAPDPLTPEGLADEVARMMLERAILMLVALALEYRPTLLRVIDVRTFDEGQALLEDEDYPTTLIDQCRSGSHAVPFQLVLHDELNEIARSRQARLRVESAPSKRSLPATRAYEQGLLGVAFSGGGIRSATFNLGVLQGLATRGWLPHIDYLSTVSGGGYIGSWLLAWIKRRGSVTAVQDSLRGGAMSVKSQESTLRNPDPGAEHVRPIRLLREYSNYLAPHLGAFSADSWTIVSIWLRNTLINLLVLVMFLMAVLIAPRLLGVVFDHRSIAMSLLGLQITDLRISMICLVAFLGLTSILIGLNLRSFDDPIVTTHSTQNGWRLFRPKLKPSERGDTPFIVIATIVVPLLIAVCFGIRALWLYAAESTPGTSEWSTHERAVAWWTFGLLTGGLAVTAAFARFWNDVTTRGERLIDRAWFARVRTHAAAFGKSVAWGVIAAAVGAILVKESWSRLLPLLFADSHRGIWIAIAGGPVVLLTVITVILVIYLGLEGLSAPDERREWWSRLGAWLALVAGAWTVIACVSFFVPYVVATAWLYAGTIGLGWSAITGIGAWLASSGESNGINLPLDKKRLTSILITVAPYLFIAGVLVGVAVLTHVVLYLLKDENIPLFSQTFTVMGPLPFSVRRYADTYWAFVAPDSLAPAVLCAALLGLSALFSWRVNVNEFSMHHFYKNRLVRAYLGASRSRVNRRPNAFTGLDMDDDIKLWRFATADVSTSDDERTDCRAGFAGPYPIINATLNMTTGDELAWQERKGQSFVFTPLYSGFDFATKQPLIAEKAAAQFAYRPTTTFANARAGQPPSECGLHIGTAVAISGAAANPNAGYHSSPAVAFFLTVLNARLGWWIGNPLLDSWNRPSPPFGLFYTLSELFGFSGVKRKYVNLSDGGHFENMGLYELVRRRCRFIVVCDGEQDDRYSFNGIAGAIRKCRVDFGVVIDLATDPIAPIRKGPSRQHIAVGDIIYPGEKGRGTLVYLKASLTGDEPSDVKEYRDGHKEFPHQTTADQFFDESQFESYRALGQHIADGAFPEWTAAPSDRFGEELDAMAEQIRKRHDVDGPKDVRV